VVPFAFSDATCAAQDEPGSAKQERDSAPWLLSDRQHRVFRLCCGTRLRLSTFRITYPADPRETAVYAATCLD